MEGTEELFGVVGWREAWVPRRVGTDDGEADGVHICLSAYAGTECSEECSAVACYSGGEVV